MKSADQKARKTQNYSISDYNLFNTLLLKAIFLLPELILLTSQFFASPGNGCGKQRGVMVHAFQNTKAVRKTSGVAL